MIPRLVSHILEFSRIDANLIYCIFELENPCGVGPTVQGNPVTLWISLFRRSLANASLLVQETWLFYRHTELCLFSMLLPCTFLIGQCVSIIFKHPTNDIEINDPSSFSDSCVANCHCLEIQAAINNWRCAPPPSFRSRQKPQGRPTQFQGFRWTLSTSIPWCGKLTSLGDGWCWVFGVKIPTLIASMYGIFTYIWLIFMGNVYR